MASTPSDFGLANRLPGNPPLDADAEWRQRGSRVQVYLLPEYVDEYLHAAGDRPSTGNDPEPGGPGENPPSEYPPPEK